MENRDVLMPHPIKFAQIKAVATWFVDIPELRSFAETGEYEEAMLVIERIIDRGSLFDRNRVALRWLLRSLVECLEIGVEFHPDFWKSLKLSFAEEEKLRRELGMSSHLTHHEAKMLAFLFLPRSVPHVSEFVFFGQVSRDLLIDIEDKAYFYPQYRKAMFALRDYVLAQLIDDNSLPPVDVGWWNKSIQRLKDRFTIE